MGGGDLNMKKSWHPVLLVNQERVWKAEKTANEEKKKLAQLRKEQEEERQLAELQRLQEQSTGKKRVDKLDWMYAAPSNEGGALGGARIGEKEMEDYLLGKRRVDEVLKAGEQNIGNMHKEFIAVQNANSARDTAAKIREDPLLAIKQQEQAAMAALANRPEIRKQLKEMQKLKAESKEERRARKKAEKEELRQARHEKKHRHSHSYPDSRSPRSDYSDERDHKRSRRDSYSSRRGTDSYDSRRDDRYQERSRSHRRDVPRRYRDESPRRSNGPGREDDVRSGHSRDDARFSRHNGHDVKPHPSQPSAMDMAERPASSPTAPANGNALDDMRAARLAAMSSSADQLSVRRTKSLAERAEEEKRQAEKDERMRAKYGKDEANAQFFKLGGEVGLSESLQRRGGKGLQRDF